MMSKNHLAKEKSPYLIQHSENPVDWYPYSEEALSLATSQNKPIFLSVGYSTCHWCHVMEHESFEDQETADYLNEHFISIKIDREERPDIDQLYMTAVQAMTGQGGWPLSVFLTPDKKPFYGGTYFPKTPHVNRPSFMQILRSIVKTWQETPEKISKAGDEYVSFLNNQLKQFHPADQKIDQNLIYSAVNTLMSHFDATYGGFSTAPKFPTAHQLSFLMIQNVKNQDTSVLDAVLLTLDKMSSGGIFDHVGGGFHRYSTDEKWHVPHFEKMLYDQAIITTAYLQAYQVTKERRYLGIAERTLQYVADHLLDTKGYFYSAEDADSYPTQNSKEKVEGAFYVWEYQELLNLLGNETGELVADFFGCQRGGNAEEDPFGEFENKNIFYLPQAQDEFIKSHDLQIKEWTEILKSSLDVLREHRVKRPKPHLDDKMIVDWNGLMISSFLLAYRLTHHKKYLTIARNAIDFILEKMVTDKGRLMHRYRDGEVAFKGMLEDYAFFGQALLDMFQVTLEEKYLLKALSFSDQMLELFYDIEKGGFYKSGSDVKDILMHSKDTFDGAQPSGNSVAQLNLFRLYHLTGEKKYLDVFEKTLHFFLSHLIQYPTAYTQHLIAIFYYLSPTTEVFYFGDTKNEAYRKIREELSCKILTFITEINVSDLSEEAKMNISFLKQFSQDKMAFEVVVCHDQKCQDRIMDLESLRKILN